MDITECGQGANRAFDQREDEAGSTPSTYQIMNLEIVKLLRMSGVNYEIYAASRIEELEAACREAWNAFDNGKRKHHRDALTGRCILGCQACAIEKLKRVLPPNERR